MLALPTNFLSVGSAILLFLLQESMVGKAVLVL
jgi:hypothetical protein